MSDSNFRTAFSWRALGLLLGFTLLAVLAIRSQRPPAPLGLGAEPSLFSATRAATHLSWIAAEPHPVGTKAHDRQRDHLITAFKKAGLEVQVQRTSVASRNGQRVAWVGNVLARLPGSAPNGAVALVCHYDSVPGSFGAADDGAGMAVSLEILRALKVGPRLRQDVIFLVTDGEELGLMGALAFVQDHPWAKEVKRVVNLEARGSGGQVHMFETSPGNADLIRALAQASNQVAATSLAYEVYKAMPNDTDLTVFKQAGWRGMGLAFIDRPWDYHHPTDCTANLDPRSLQQMGDVALGLVRGFASSDLGPGSGKDAIYFNPLGTWFVHYPQAVATWLSLLAVLLAMAMLWRGLRSGGLQAVPLLKALALLPASLLVATLIGAGLGRALRILHGLWHVPDALSFTFNPWYPLCVLGLSLITTWALLRFTAQRLGIQHLHAAGLVTWTLVTILVGSTVPGMTYALQIPLLLALGGALLQPGSGRAQIPAALAVILLYAPLLVMVNTGLGFSWLLAAGLALLLLLLAWLVLPLLQEARSSGLLLPLGSVLLLIVPVAAGLWTRRTFEHRHFVYLTYNLNADSKQSWWEAGRVNQDPWLQRILAHPLPGRPGWQGDGRIRPHSQEAFFYQDAPLLQVPEPKLSLLSDESRNGLRVLRLSALAPGASALWIRGEDARFRQGSVMGLPLRSPGNPASGWMLLFHAPPSEPLIVELTFQPGGGPIELGLQGQWEGLPVWPGHDLALPPGVHAIWDGHSTVVTRLLKVP